MLSSWLLSLLAANAAFETALAGRSSQHNAWQIGNFKTLVTFGDSYTDENRLGYFISHDGSAPPVAWDQPVGLATATGGLSWARYASIYSNISLYNYAVSGAVCSNQVTPRWFANINAPFPDIDGYELPAFIADSKAVTANGKFFTGTPDNTVYAIWIGTNDLGNNAFLTDSQIAGKTVKDYIDCVYNQVGRLYDNGGRFFVLLNLAPLDLLPQYALPEDGGLPSTPFFPEKLGKNGTEIHGRILESVTALNQVYKYRTPFEAEISGDWKGAHFANFDVNALMTDIHSHPANYLNGTAPLNVTGVAHLCDNTGANCTVTSQSDRDSYEWFDPLHPSEQTSRVIAREFVSVVSGKSKYATYWA